MIEFAYIIAAFTVGHVVGSRGWLRISPTSRKKNLRTHVTAEERDMLLK